MGEQSNPDPRTNRWGATWCQGGSELTVRDPMNGESIEVDLRSPGGETTIRIPRHEWEEFVDLICRRMGR